jgi:hypothetical protein
MRLLISRLFLTILCLSTVGCSTTPELDQNFGKNIRESFRKQVVDPKNPDQKESPVQYPFTNTLMK